MSDSRAPRVKSDLPTRFVAGVVMIAVAITVTMLGGWWFRALVVAAATLMIVEWSDIHRIPRVAAYLGAVLLAVLLLIGTQYFFPVGQRDVQAGAAAMEPIWLAFGGVGAIALLAGLISRRFAMIGGVLYVGIPSIALLALEWSLATLVFWIFAVTWATDILAYFAGRAIGGPRLAPRISPKKTWAGLLGGMAGAALFGWLVARLFQMDPLFLWLGAPMGFIAQGGDLFESWFKRRAGVKDSGTILPGHGGVLDRVDGLLAVAFATCLVLLTGLWTA